MLSECYKYSLLISPFIYQHSTSLILCPISCLPPSAKSFSRSPFQSQTLCHSYQNLAQYLMGGLYAHTVATSICYYLSPSLHCACISFDYLVTYNKPLLLISCSVKSFPLEAQLFMTNKYVQKAFKYTLSHNIPHIRTNSSI